MSCPRSEPAGGYSSAKRAINVLGAAVDFAAMNYRVRSVGLESVRSIMKWIIEGADESSGQEQHLTLEARDRDEAERLARYRGVLVSSVRADLAPSLEYRRPDATPAEAPGGGANLPHYPQILLGCWLLRWLAWCVVGLAALCLLGAGLTLAMPLFRGRIKYMTWLDWLAVITSAVAPTIYGLFLLIVAVFLRLAGGLALAFRDIARNSFLR